MIEHTWVITYKVISESNTYVGAISHIYWTLKTVNYSNKKITTRSDVTHWVIDPILSENVDVENEATHNITSPSMVDVNTFTPLDTITNDMLISWVHKDLKDKNLFDIIINNNIKQVS